MKKPLLFFVLICQTVTIFGQVLCGGIAMPEDWSFDGYTPEDYSVRIDTVSNPNNIWQIGVPQKTTINTAYSSPNVIITDTINSYPINDTSVFIFKYFNHDGYGGNHAQVAGYYEVSSDSLKDYGTIEISLDGGFTWINLITDYDYDSYYYWMSPKPVLTGNSHGWQYFIVELSGLGNVFNLSYGDSILLKFAFISDSIADTLDGLAYDSFQFCDGSEGIEEKTNASLISIFPNPTDDILYITRLTQPERESVQIFNYIGQLVYEDHCFKSDNIITKKLNLKDGLYFLKYSDTKSYVIKQFIVIH